jgi:hypothetical protein
MVHVSASPPGGIIPARLALSGMARIIASCGPAAAETPMAYCLVQIELRKPPEEAIRSAFESVEELTDLDAGFACRDAYGVLVERLEHEQARTLQRALAGQGIATEIVEEADLPELPVAVKFRRAEVRDDGLVILDALNRPRLKPWPSIEIVASGCVRMIERQRIQTQRTKLAGVGLSGRFAVVPVVVTDIHHKELQKDNLVLEVYCRGEDGLERHRAFGDQFRYDALGGRMDRSYAVNFARMAREVIDRATCARRNRGAAAIGEGRGRTYRYPSRHAFEEEIVWLLWRGQLGST